MRIVTDGEKFALAKGSWLFSVVELADLRERDIWWLVEGHQNQYCWGTLEKVQMVEEYYKRRKKKFWRYKKR